MRYNGNSREEKGREASNLVDGYGRLLTPDQAIALMGGEEAPYHNSIWSPSEADRAFLEEKFGGREEAQRSMGLLMLERTGAKDALFAIHDHGEDGWHLHLTRRGLPEEKLYGETGAFQRAWDREMEALRGEADRPILDWEAHSQFKEIREELKRVQVEQRVLAKERFMALRATKDEDQKAEIRREFRAREEAIIRTRYDLELRAAEARYSSRGMAGSASHRIEVERIEQRTSTAFTRMEGRDLGQDLQINRKIAWTHFTDQQKRFEAEKKSFAMESKRIEKKHTEDLERARLAAEKSGELGSPAFTRRVQEVDLVFRQEREALALRMKEAAARHQGFREATFALGQASKGFLEKRGVRRSNQLAREREEMERRHADQVHELRGTLGSAEHQRAIERAGIRREEAEVRHRRDFVLGPKTRAIQAAFKAGTARRQAKEREALETRWAREEFGEKRSGIDAHHATAGTLGSKEHTADLRRNEAQLDARVGEIRLRSAERQAAARMPVLRALAPRGALGRIAVEAAEEKRLITTAKQRRDRSLEAVEARHVAAGTLGSREHKLDLKRVTADFQDEKRKITGKGRGAAKDAAVSKGKRAVSKAVVAVKEAGKKAIQAVRNEVRGKAHRDLQLATRPAQEAGRAAAKAALAMTQEAILAAGRAGKELAIHTATAGAKLGAGLVAAIPTGGLSLKAAAKEAGRDLAEGAKGAAKESAKGGKNVTREGVGGAAQVAVGALRGVKGLAEELVPHDGAASVLKAAHEGAKALGQTAFKAAQLDLTGAGKAAVLGALRTGKEAAGAAAKAAELPAALKLPLQLTEKLPVIGQVASLVKTVTEVTTTTAKSVEIDL